MPASLDGPSARVPSAPTRARSTNGRARASFHPLSRVLGEFGSQARRLRLMSLGRGLDPRAEMVVERPQRLHQVHHRLLHRPGGFGAPQAPNRGHLKSEGAGPLQPSPRPTSRRCRGAAAACASRRGTARASIGDGNSQELRVTCTSRRARDDLARSTFEARSGLSGGACNDQSQSIWQQDGICL